MKKILKSIKVEEDTAHLIWVMAKSARMHQYEYLKKLMAAELNRNPEMLAYAERMGIEL